MNPPDPSEDALLLQDARVIGMSLALKSALASTVMLVVVMTTFGILTYSTSKAALNREIDVFGASLARALAIPDPDTWRATSGSLLEAIRRLLEAYARYDAYLSERYGIAVYPTASSMDDADDGGTVRTPRAQEQRRQFQEELERIAERNRGRLSRLVRYDDQDAPAEIVDAFIKYEDENLSVVRANLAAPPFRPTSAERVFLADAGSRKVPTDIRITEGSFPGVGPARMFTHPIREAGGRVTHRAFVFLSERTIDARLKTLLGKILACTIAFIAIGAVSTFLLTRHMTAPLSDLVHDIEIVSGGDLRHRTVARSKDEIGLLARTFDRMVRSLEAARAERTKHRALEHEVAVASEVQSKLLPEGIPIVPGYELGVVRVTTGEVGGVYYDFLDLQGGRMGIILAEGTGRGIPAAMTVVMTRALLRSEADRTADPGEILRRCNATLARDLRKGMYVSALFAVLDQEARSIEIYGAGRVSLLHVRASDATTGLVVPDGIALGLDSGPVFDRSLRATRLTLEEGDRLVLHTGAPERMQDASGRPLGGKRWEAIVGRIAAGAPGTFVASVQAALASYRGTAELAEDLVAVTLRVGPRKSLG